MYVGAIRFMYLAVQWVYFNYFARIDINAYKYGWIVVTGATAGIGKGLCEVLSSQQFKLVLISRDKSKLENLVSDLSKTTSNSNIRYIVADFSYSHRSPENFYKDLMEKLSEFEISGLINNVGVLNLSKLVNQDLDKIENILGVNIYPQTMLSYHIIQQFLERFEKKKLRSLLVNISSSADFVSMSTLSVYTASKRYSDYLSEGIRIEYNFAVDVATVKPAIVETDMVSSIYDSKLSGLSLAVGANPYAESLIRNLHKGINYGHWKHSVFIFLFTLLPSQVINPLLSVIMPKMLMKYGIIKADV